QINEKVGEVTISFRIVKNSEPISLAEGSFAFMRLVLQQPVKSWADQWWPQSDRAGVRLYDVKTGEEIVAAALARADGSEIRCEDMVCKLCTSRSEALA
ncbi:MAG: hypothetical protein INH06_29095, partial [Cupriavidus sp.]|nr:hypothetical protein [Cupriavidus sp.]